MDNSRMRKYIAVFVISAFFTGCGKGVEVPGKTGAPAETVPGAGYKKELEEIRRNIRSDIRIKLKKDARGGYGWEITGRDPQEVIKANNILKSRVNGERRE